MTKGRPSLTYAQLGVDVDAGDALVKRIAPLARATARPGADSALGGFGGLLDLDATGFSDPILVAATDGVSTKLRIAIDTCRLTTVGIDLVVMCVNDLLAQGAKPLFFLDYYATGRLDIEAAARVVEGIAAGCREAGCALIGGETAEIPGMCAPGDFDLAGFAVGAAERGRLLPRADIGAGDILLGIASNGLHSNGFALVRGVVEASGLDWAAEAPFTPGRTLADALLAPTRLYVRPLLPLIRTGRVEALAHITGGGLPENLPRVLPPGLTAGYDAHAWEWPPVFRWLMKKGGIAGDEMLRTFNCGVGMAAVCSEDDADEVIRMLTESDETVFPIGRIAVAP